MTRSSTISKRYFLTIVNVLLLSFSITIQCTDHAGNFQYYCIFFPTEFNILLHVKASLSRTATGYEIMATTGRKMLLHLVYSAAKILIATQQINTQLYAQLLIYIYINVSIIYNSISGAIVLSPRSINIVRKSEMSKAA